MEEVMRNSGKERSNWKVEEQLINGNKSFVHFIENWEEVIPHINFSGEYEKGTPTISRSLTYHQKFNAIAEEIMNGSKRYKTITEVLRIALNIGIQVLYYVFVKHQNLKSKGYASHYFKQLELSQHRHARAEIVETFLIEIQHMQEDVSKGSMPSNDATRNLQQLYDSVPDDDKPYVSELLKPKTGQLNVIDFIKKISAS
jgi:hypothetical protein